MTTRLLRASNVVVALVGLTACDPIYYLDLTIVVPPELTTDLTAEAPAQLQVLALPSLAFGGSIAGLCEPEEEEREFAWPMRDYGCAEPTTVTVWLVPVPADRIADFTCGDTQYEESEALGEPSEDDPMGEGTALDSGACPKRDTVEITLAAP